MHCSGYPAPTELFEISKWDLCFRNKKRRDLYSFRGNPIIS
jgi:hypothetical protein